MITADITETILREIQHQLKDALANAQRDRELAHRAVLRVDQFEARFDSVAADIRSRFDSIVAEIRTIRSDIASIDIKLAALPEIEITIRSLRLENKK